ncbi:hypothetical protein GUB10_15810 [Salegentibacter sp. BLCTC]|uniref:hypothetical protein n=1 Tax=Salegentibacter sp. BLCTC TaxID=2697368 RepID=UPI00187B11E8|nr:hypothetical protein [Salegentibacter sp. BLCTC]MBE7641796.1 hypothetical protein [Salegentibacter sp. BLCTC]
MKTEIEKRASKFIDETDMMQFSTMEIMVMFAEKELEAINYTRCCKSVKGEQVPTFDEFIDKFNLEADRDNEYFFDNEYFDAMGLYYKYAEHYGINP